MKKYKWKIILSRMLKKDSKNINKFIIYNNPKICSSFRYENINPEHVFIIWGKRKEKHKGKNWIKICKIYFTNFAMILSTYFKDFINTIIYVFEHVDVFVFVYSMLIAIIFYTIVLQIDLTGVFISMKKLII